MIDVIASQNPCRTFIARISTTSTPATTATRSARRIHTDCRVQFARSTTIHPASTASPSFLPEAAVLSAAVRLGALALRALCLSPNDPATTEIYTLSLPDARASSADARGIVHGGATEVRLAAHPPRLAAARREVGAGSGEARGQL